MYWRQPASVAAGRSRRRLSASLVRHQCMRTPLPVRVLFSRANRRDGDCRRFVRGSAKRGCLNFLFTSNDATRAAMSTQQCCVRLTIIESLRGHRLTEALKQRRSSKKTRVELHDSLNRMTSIEFLAAILAKKTESPTSVVRNFSQTQTAIVDDVKDRINCYICLHN
jgi:hypothetical protein